MNHLTAQQVRTGLYQHHRGGLYRVLGPVSIPSLDATLVLVQHQEQNGQFLGSPVAIDAAEFNHRNFVGIEEALIGDKYVYLRP